MWAGQFVTPDFCEAATILFRSRLTTRGQLRGGSLFDRATFDLADRLACPRARAIAFQAGLCSLLRSRNSTGGQMSILAREDHVFLCPSVDLPAMGAAQFAALDFCGGPQAFFDRLTARG
jgi:hypothetical protein